MTNNSQVSHALQYDFKVFYREAAYLDILYETRNKVHRGYKLLTHPLAGSLKPNQTPFKSVMLTRDDSLVDFASVTMIENCIMSAEKFLNQKTIPAWNDKILDDFRTIDLSLMESAANNPMLKMQS